MSSDYNKLPEEMQNDFQQAQKNLDITPLSQIEETTVSWLFPGRVPCGEVTIMAGDGGSGKTFAICDLIASITTGRKSLFDHDSGFPEGWTNGTPGTVLFFSSEDDFSKVLVGRLKKAGADISRVNTIQITDERFGQLKFNSQLTADLIAKYRPTLAVFDPLQSYIPSEINMSSRNEMRNCLNSLIGLGRLYATSFIILMHTNKRLGVAGRQRIADSADVWDLVRSVLIFGNADHDGTRYISHEKSNYGKLADTILFRISDDGTVEYMGTSDLKDYDYVLNESRERSAASPAKVEAKEFILSQLRAAKDHYLESEKLISLAKASGISERTLRRAREDLISKDLIGKGQKGFAEKKHYIYLKIHTELPE